MLQVLLINKMGFKGKAFEMLQHIFLNFEKFLLNHNKNIVIVYISQKFGGGQY